MTKIEIREQAMGLPQKDRLHLAMDLFESVEQEEAPPISDALKRLLNARLKRHKENPEDAIPWEVAHEEILGSLRSAR